MEYKYFTLPLFDKTVYFKINIDKRQVDQNYNYFIKINELFIYQCDLFDEYYGGLFICIDENNKLKICDNIEKKDIVIDKSDDITYVYNSKKYGNNLDNTIKEILYQIFVNYSVLS